MNHLVAMLLVLAAGVLAGVIGTAGGITSLVSFPTLVAVGLSPLAAAVANNVALVGCLPGAAIASRTELAGQRGRLLRWLPVAALGGGAGAALLLVTGESTFERIIPVLIVFGSLALLAQPALLRLRERLAPDGSRLALLAGLLVINVYNGYFGGGSGILVLVLLLVLVEPLFAKANAAKNIVIGASQLACALVFVLASPVRWWAVVPLGIGMFAGSLLGPRVARHVPAATMRYAITGYGLAIAALLFVDPTL